MLYNNPKVGEIIDVRVSNINQTLGAFVTMPNGKDGLIRLRDISWTNPQKILSSLSIREWLRVKIIQELPDGKLNLSRVH